MVSTYPDCLLNCLLKEFPSRNESFAFSASPSTQPKLYVWVYDHKTLGKDKALGSAEIDVSRRFLLLHGRDLY